MTRMIVGDRGENSSIDGSDTALTMMPVARMIVGDRGENGNIDGSDTALTMMSVVRKVLKIEVRMVALMVVTLHLR